MTTIRHPTRLNGASQANDRRKIADAAVRNGGLLRSGQYTYRMLYNDLSNADDSLSLEAAVLSNGFRRSYYTKADVERWAERKIESLPEPSLTVIELATLRDTYEQDVLHLLDSLRSSQHAERS